METLLHNINGKDYLLIDVPVTFANEKSVNEILSKFDTIDQSVSLLAKNVLLRKVLISCTDVANFQSEIKLINDRLDAQSSANNEYNYAVFHRVLKHLSIATAVIFVAMIIYTFAFKS